MGKSLVKIFSKFVDWERPEMKTKYVVNSSKKTPEIFVVGQEKTDLEKKIDENSNGEGEANFEEAIEAVGYGKFHWLLILFAIPCSCAGISETSTMSLILPIAQCDLNLSLENKGMLNAITYLGAITSAFLWGYLADTLGRKKLLFGGFLADFAFAIMASLSQNFTMLMFAKYMTGFIITGPTIILISYISEFHSSKHRARLPLGLGLINHVACISLPILGWAILPLNINWSFSQEGFFMHSWQVFLLICASASLISGLISLTLPESPKFLMTVGRNEEALKVFQKVYSINTGKPPETYPVKKLVDEIEMNKKEEHKHGGIVTANRTKCQALKEGWQQITPLFFPPHIANFALVISIQFCVMLGLNTLRLWMPQIFTAINDYRAVHNQQTDELCMMINALVPSSNSSSTCVVNNVNDTVYINTMIMSLVSIVGYLITGTIINLLGKKNLLLVMGAGAGVIGISIYFTKDEISVLALSSLYICMCSIFSNTIISVTVDLFPTSLRATTVCLSLMFGRVGSMIGNLLFPILLVWGCLPPFVTIGFIVLTCSVMTIFLPKTDMKALE